MKNKRFFYSLALPLILISFLGASCKKTSDGGVFKSIDGGVTWEQKVFVGQQKKKVITISDVNVQDIAVDPTNSDIAYLATRENGIYKTDNGGDVWWQLSVTPDRIRDIAIDVQYPNNIYAVKNNNIIKSVDSGENWEIIYTDTQGAIITRLDVDWYNQQRLMAVTSIGTVLTSEDEGRNWQVVYQVEEPLVGLVISHTDSRIFYVVELDKALHKTTDGGKTWTDLMDNDEFDTFRDENEAQRANKVKIVTMDPNNSNVLYAVTEDGIIKTTDGGKSWEFVNTLIERGATQNTEIKAYTVKPDDSNTMYFGVKNLIHHTEDGGQTWQTIEDFPSKRRITAFYIDPKEQTTVQEVQAESNQEPTTQEITAHKMYIGVEKIEEKRSGFFGAPPSSK